MTLILRHIEQMAPGQESLKAASKLLKPGLWPLRARDAGESAAWTVRVRSETALSRQRR